MITEKNHKLLTSQLFVTDCTKKGLASMTISYLHFKINIDIKQIFLADLKFKFEWILKLNLYIHDILIEVTFCYNDFMIQTYSSDNIIIKVFVLEVNG